MKQSNINLVLTFEIARYHSFEMWILTLHFNTLSNFSYFKLRGFLYQNSYRIALFIDSLSSLLIM